MQIGSQVFLQSNEMIVVHITMLLLLVFLAMTLMIFTVMLAMGECRR